MYVRAGSIEVFHHDIMEHTSGIRMISRFGWRILTCYTIKQLQPRFKTASIMSPIRFETHNALPVNDLMTFDRSNEFNLVLTDDPRNCTNQKPDCNIASKMLCTKLYSPVHHGHSFVHIVPSPDYIWVCISETKSFEHLHNTQHLYTAHTPHVSHVTMVMVKSINEVPKICNNHGNQRYFLLIFSTVF